MLLDQILTSYSETLAAQPYRDRSETEDAHQESEYAKRKPVSCLCCPITHKECPGEAYDCAECNDHQDCPEKKVSAEPQSNCERTNVEEITHSNPKTNRRMLQ